MERDDPIVEWAKKREKAIRRQHRLAVFRKRFGIGPAIILVALLIAAGIVVVRNVHGHGSASPVSAMPAPSESSSAAPGTVSVKTTASAKATGPFAGTPAANYPKGAAGFVVPPAKAVLGFSAKQVQTDLAKVRAALIASRLDPKMTAQHNTSAFLAMLDPASRKVATQAVGTDAGLSLMTWLDPKTPLDPAEQPRVSGQISYASWLHYGQPTLEVTTNFIEVYAFDRDDHPVAATHDQIVWWFFSEPQDMIAADRGGVFLESETGYSAFVDCDAARHGLLGPTPLDNNSSPNPQDSGNPAQYLSATHGLDIPDDCGLSK